MLGPRKPELVRGPRRQIILVVADKRHLPRHAGPHRRVAENQVHVDGRALAGEHADGASVTARVDTRGLERIAGAFKEDTLLRIDEFRFARAIIEKLGIE